MAYTPQLKKANVNVEVLIRTPEGDPLFYDTCTLGLWAGSDVLAIDESEKTTSPGRMTICDPGTDSNILGIAATGTRDWRIRDEVAMYGMAPLTLEKVGCYRKGKVRVRLTNDYAGSNIGDILQAVADSQTIEEVSAQTVCAAIPMVWEVITAAAPTADDIILLHTDISECLGMGVEALAEAAGGDEHDRRGKLILDLQPYRLLTKV